MFFSFWQNNVGGVWQGPELVVVEAESADQANLIAEDYGIYFGGVAEGRDCRCCGNRWSRAHDAHAEVLLESLGARIDPNTDRSLATEDDGVLLQEGNRLPLKLFC